MTETHREVQRALDRAFRMLGRVLATQRAGLVVEEVGIVRSIGPGMAQLEGLPNVRAEAVVQFEGGLPGIAFNLDPAEVGVVLLGQSGGLLAGDNVYRTGRVVDIPVGEALLGRVVDATGRPLDGRGEIEVSERRPIEREAPAMMDRAPVSVPLQTGIKVIDALIPIGRGQRELIVGDRQTGKTAIALDAVINQKDKGVLCIYCCIGQRSAAVAKLIATLREQNAMDYCTVVVASGEDPPGLQFVAPYAATTIAEYFMDRRRDVLIVYDDLTHHAWAYRELSLLLRRPPGREAYPGDIFYIHSRLLERSTHLRQERGGGSLTALPIIETQAQDISAYIPTNLISITDGQIYLSPFLFQKGVLPAVDVGKSVSRVGGKAQLPAYASVAEDLRLTYAQFMELEAFARFGTRLEPETRRRLERGQRVREVLKQPQYEPVPVAEQIAVLLAATTGLFDDLKLDRVGEAEEAIRRAVREEVPALSQRILAGETFRKEDRELLLSTADRAISALQGAEHGASH